MSEREIPVLTVWKNNSILKNIFLINKNPPNINNNNNNNNQENDDNQAKIQDLEETLLVGRHPNCDIRLEHPSISRFHLKIHSLPNSKQLFLTDLSSVHGTWVSGKRIEPTFRTMVKEGDHLRIGGSSRVYKLHWIPLSQAYDVSKPFVPPLDFLELQEDEDEIIQDEISVGMKVDVRDVDSNSDDSKGLESLNLCGDDQMIAEKELVQASPFLDQQEDEGETIKADISVGIKDEEMHNVDNISDDIPKGPESLGFCGDDQMIVEKVLPQASPLQPHKLVSVKDEANDLVDINFEDLDSPCLDDISEEVEHKLAPPIRKEDFENEDIQSVDSILEGLVPLLMGDISQELEQREMFLAPPIHNKDNENEDVQSADSILEGLVPLFMGENWEWVAQKEDYLPCPTEEDHPQSSKDDESELASPLLEGLDTLFLDNSSELLMPEDMEFPTIENTHNIIPEDRREFVPEILEDVQDEGRELVSPVLAGLDNSQSLKDDEKELVSPVLDGLDTLFSDDNSELLMPEDMEFPTAENTHNIIAEERREFVPEILEDVQDNAWSFWCGTHVAPSIATAGNLWSTECHHLSIANETPDHESVCSANEHQENELWSFWSGKMGVESVCSALSDAEVFSESENKSLNSYLSSPLSSLTRQGDSPLITSEQKSASIFWSGMKKREPSIGLCLSGSDSFSESDKESCGEFYQSPDSLSSVKGRYGSPLMASDRNPLDSIWSKSVKLVDENKVKTPQKDVKHEPISRDLFEEVFTPDKENFTPATHKSMRKSAVLKDISNSCSCKSPLLTRTCNHDNPSEDVISALSNKENYQQGSRQKEKTSRNQVNSIKHKERKGVRMPCQSLLANSPHKTVTECHIADNKTKSASSDHCANAVSFKEKRVRNERRQWNIVVDTTTLLNKESRKALELLEGLKGTHLIIPRIVITELTRLKRQVSFFRRNTEALSALEWIQECMMRSGWWVHVQNSTEEDRPVEDEVLHFVPSQFSFFAFSGFESRREVLSPNVEDDVLDFALGFKKTNFDGQLVLLSNDVTVKIKAMAEGMICETGEQFRESLVNPFSERFRWTDSSPRGQTWSHADDFVLKKKFYPSSLMMTPNSRENANGLKLLLLEK